MLTVKSMTKARELKWRFEFEGLDQDEKPIGTYGDKEIANGSSIFAMDTSTVYKYDEENDQWLEL